MNTGQVLPTHFYERPPQAVARSLLGAVLVRNEGGRRMSGLIVEAEAYHGQTDLACHARHGLTARTRVMFGPPGKAYVYFTYGNHWMLNAVCEPEGMASAVLVRAIHPLEGLEWIAGNRPRPPARRSTRPGQEMRGWTDGPGKLCQALKIPEGGLWIEAGETIPDEQVIIGPRVGIQSVPEPWLSKPWRYRVNPGYLAEILPEEG
jgi:DNA-3-methyladenine glycosylase